MSPRPHWPWDSCVGPTLHPAPLPLGGPGCANCGPQRHRERRARHTEKLRVLHTGGRQLLRRRTQRVPATPRARYQQRLARPLGKWGGPRILLLNWSFWSSRWKCRREMKNGTFAQSQKIGGHHRVPTGDAGSAEPRPRLAGEQRNLSPLLPKQKAPQAPWGALSSMSSDILVFCRSLSTGQHPQVRDKLPATFREVPTAMLTKRLIQRA